MRKIQINRHGSIKLLLAIIILIPVMGQSADQDLSDDSIYHMDADWQNQKGEIVKLKDFIGKKLVLSMVYTRCPHTCPLIISYMSFIQNALLPEEKNKVHFLLVSLTPESDTVEVLHKFSQKRELDLETWSLLRGDAGDVRALAMAINVKYKATADGEIAHSNMVSILDEEGRIKFQEIGLKSNTEDVVTRMFSDP